MGNEWESACAWDPPAALPLRGVIPVGVRNLEQTKPSITVKFATDAYVANRAGRGIAPSTLRKYTTFTEQLSGFATYKGCMLVDQFTITDMDEFYSLWKDGIRAKAKKIERLKGFLQFCVKRKWIAEYPAADLEVLVGAGSASQPHGLHRRGAH